MLEGVSHCISWLLIYFTKIKAEDGASRILPFSIVLVIAFL